MIRKSRIKVFSTLWVLSALALFAPGCSCGDDDDDDDSGTATDDDAADDDDDADDDTAADDDAADDDAGPFFFAGASRVDISPASDWPLKMGGYGIYFLSENMCRWSTGVHDPLFATAIAVRDRASAPLVFVNLDLVGVVITDVVRIQDGVALAAGIDAERVIVTASHTHGSPDSVGIWGVIVPPISGRDEAYMDQVVEGAIASALDAIGDLRPARLFFSTGTEPDMHYNSNDVLDPTAMVDSTMTVMAMRDPDGAPIASMMSWGCHPMVMGPQNTEVTADFAGAYYRLMDDEVGGVNMFVNGSLGASVHPINPFDPWDYGDGREWGTWQDVDNTGRVLADDAQDLLDTARETGDTHIETVTQPLFAKLQNPFFYLVGTWGIIPRDVPNLGEDGETKITAVSIGPAQFATVPGELVPDISFILRGIMGGEHQFVMNLGQDWVGYVILPEQFFHIAYIYNDLLSVGPQTGTALIDGYANLYADWRGEE